MRVPIKWIRDFVDIDIPVKELADKLTMSGTKTEIVIDVSENIENVVVGKIVEIFPHPNADKLVVTKVDVNKSENLQIVTGASNISVGNFVPVALDNSKLPSKKEPYYIKIKKGKLRGEISEGMLCSSIELGIEEKYIDEKSKGGIFLLPHNLEIGQNIVEALDLKDYIIEFEITSNRPDCLSMIGIAREVAAVLDKKIKLPENDYEENGEEFNFDASVEDKNLCPRYMLKKIEDVKIVKSPYKIQRRLIEAGVRPINNIVDITNYVLLEYGQPMHAFDAGFLSKNKVVVKRAKDNEKFITLDEKERTLDSSMLMITDGNENLAIAGVMGGLNSEITDDTTSVIFESANFDSESIRLTSKKLGLKTDSSIRFEKGIDVDRAKKAIDKACHMIEENGWGRVCKGEIDILNRKNENKEIKISHDDIQNAIGNEISTDEIDAIFEKLCFEYSCENGNYIVKAPNFRLDIALKADIYEEIARMYGYDNIKSVNMVSQVTFSDKSASKKFEEKSKNSFVSVGMNEIITYSFIGEKDLEKIEFPKENLVKLLNPLGEDTSVMRTTLIPTMLNVISNNYNRKNPYFSGFEIGNIFEMGKIDPIQKKEIIGAMYGEDVTFFTLKEKLEGYFSQIRIMNIRYEIGNLNGFFHPNRTAIIKNNDDEIGYIGQVNPIIADKYDINSDIYMFILDFQKIMNLSDAKIIYSEISKFPSIKRDISFIVGSNININQIEDAIKSVNSDIIEKVELFDIYEGKQLGSDKKSLSYSFTYQDVSRTLKDDEVNKVQSQIIKALEDKVGAVLRDK